MTTEKETFEANAYRVMIDLGLERVQLREHLMASLAREAEQAKKIEELSGDVERLEKWNQNLAKERDALREDNAKAIAVAEFVGESKAAKDSRVGDTVKLVGDDGEWLVNSLTLNVEKVGDAGKRRSVDSNYAQLVTAYEPLR